MARITSNASKNALFDTNLNNPIQELDSSDRLFGLNDLIQLTGQQRSYVLKPAPTGLPTGTATYLSRHFTVRHRP